MAKKSTKQSDILVQSIEVANKLVSTLSDTIRNSARRSPEPWTKALTIANIFLAGFTLLYVLLTYSVLNEMKRQSDLAQRNLAETLRAQVLMALDSVQLHTRPFGGHPANTITAQVRVENNGNTPAELEFTSLDAFQFDRHQANARDSLLSPVGTAVTFSETGGSIPKFIPPHSSIRFVGIIEDISGRIRPDGTFYVHYIIIFKDIFKLYHDVYSVTQFDIDFSHRGIGFHNPAYSFHDYTDEETKLILHKSDVALSPKR